MFSTIKHRTAFTLVELLMTMTAGSTIMLLAIGILHQSLRLASACSSLDRDDRSATRLAHDFRGDAMRARNVAEVSDTSIIFQNADGLEIQYTTENGRIVRRVAIPGQSFSFESYAFDAYSVKFSLDDDSRRVSLAIARKSIVADGSFRIERHVVASIGRLAQLETSEGSR